MAEKKTKKDCSKKTCEACGGCTPKKKDNENFVCCRVKRDTEGNILKKLNKNGKLVNDTCDHTPHIMFYGKLTATGKKTGVKTYKYLCQEHSESIAAHEELDWTLPAKAYRTTEEAVKASSQPLIVAYGVGLDSTAMLVEMYNRGIRPDRIVFADVGGEKLETYAYIPIMNEWLKKVGFPQITIVRNVPGKNTPYRDLEGNCIKNETLPSLAYGGHSCSIKWKIVPQNKDTCGWEPAQGAWRNGQSIIKAIGYDDSKADRRRSKKAYKIQEDSPDPRFTYWYPLQEWGLERTQLAAIIEAAELPVPLKSACFFCPASQKWEIVWLRDNHQNMFERAIAIEEGARYGKHGLRGVKGLSRSYSWLPFRDGDGDDLEENDLDMP